MKPKSGERIKMILDVDCGVDDAHALMLALSDPRADILAITCVQGNTALENVCRNTLRILKLCHRTDIPVYRGSSKPLIGAPLATNFHGEDGLGDTENPDDVNMALIRTEPAASAIVKIVNNNVGDVTLFAVAPLTNIALALRLDPDLGKKLKSATIMGGNVEGQGNIKTAGEFNFSADVEAAHIVLDELQCPINLLTMERTVKHAMPMTWFNQWIQIDTKRGRFNKRITGKLIENMIEDTMDNNSFVMYDAMAMTTLLYPECVLDSVQQYCCVELHGEYTRGMMVVDWRGHLGRKPNVNLIMKINTDTVMKALEHSMGIEL